VVPVDTTEIAGATYLNLNDILRLLDGVKQVGSVLDVGRIEIADTEITLLDGSTVVHSEAKTWTLPHPILKRDGAVWVPETFLSAIVNPLITSSLIHRRGLILVDLSPGRLDSVAVSGYSASRGMREIVAYGKFPLSPATRTTHDRVVLDLEGCFLDEFATGAFSDSLAMGWQAQPTRLGMRLTLLLGDRVEAYALREATPERLRLDVGSAQRGMTPLEEPLAGGWKDVRRVILDAGHGGADEGAQLANGRLEKWVNLELARQLADSLRAAGYDVVMTRNEDRDLSPEDRSAFANEADGDIFLCVQLDRGDNDLRPDLKCLVHRSVGGAGRSRVVAGFRLQPWSSVHAAHVNESDRVARSLLSETRSVGLRCRQHPLEVPMRVMEGLDMPAVELLIRESVVIGAGWERWRERFAEAVVRGVMLYAGEAQL